MAKGDMLTVFCYDVSNDSNRRRVAKHLEDHATRVQYSVFEARMSASRAAAISQKIAAWLQTSDSLRVYTIGANGEQRTRVYGDGPPIETKEGYFLF